MRVVWLCRVMKEMSIPICSDIDNPAAITLCITLKCYANYVFKYATFDSLSTNHDD